MTDIQPPGQPDQGADLPGLAGDEVSGHDRRIRQLQDLRAGNAQALQRIQLAGVQPPALTALRLETLIDLIISPDERATFECVYEDRTATFLEQVEASIRKAQLGAAGRGLLVPGPAANGHPKPPR